MAPGINGKMDEVRSAYGLMALKHVDVAIESRKRVARRYREALKEVPGIHLLKIKRGLRLIILIFLYL